MKLENSDTRDKLIQRLRRIEGQVQGVQQMLNSERDCREIMIQLSAIHEAVQATSRVFLQEYATACLARMEGEGAGAGQARQREELVREMIAMLDKTP